MNQEQDNNTFLNNEQVGGQNLNISDVTLYNFETQNQVSQPNGNDNGGVKFQSSSLGNNSVNNVEIKNTDIEEPKNDELTIEIIDNNDIGKSIDSFENNNVKLDNLNSTSKNKKNIKLIIILITTLIIISIAVFIIINKFSNSSKTNVNNNIINMISKKGETNNNDVITKHIHPKITIGGTTIKLGETTYDEFIKAANIDKKFITESDTTSYPIGDKKLENGKYGGTCVRIYLTEEKNTDDRVIEMYYDKKNNNIIYQIFMDSIEKTNINNPYTFVSYEDEFIGRVNFGDEITKEFLNEKYVANYGILFNVYEHSREDYAVYISTESKPYDFIKYISYIINEDTGKLERVAVAWE